MDNKTTPNELNDYLIPNDSKAGSQTIDFDTALKYFAFLFKVSLLIGAIWSLLFFASYNFFPTFDFKSLITYLVAVAFWSLFFIAAYTLYFLVPGLSFIPAIKKYLKEKTPITTNEVKIEGAIFLSLLLSCLLLAIFLFLFFINDESSQGIIFLTFFLLTSLCSCLSLGFLTSLDNFKEWGKAFSFTFLFNFVILFTFCLNLYLFLLIILFDLTGSIEFNLSFFFSFLFLAFVYSLIFVSINIFSSTKQNLAFIRISGNYLLDKIISFIVAGILFAFLLGLYTQSSFILKFPFLVLGWGGGINKIVTVDEAYSRQTDFVSRGIKPIPITDESRTYFFSILVGIGKKYLVEYKNKEEIRTFTIDEKYINSEERPKEWEEITKGKLFDYEDDFSNIGINDTNRKDFSVITLNKKDKKEILRWKNNEKNEEGFLVLNKP